MMLFSNFTSATSAAQLACIFISKISHCKNTLKFACKKSACKSLCKNLHASFLRGFFMEICHIACNLRACKCCNARGLYCGNETWSKFDLCYCLDTHVHFIDLHFLCCTNLQVFIVGVDTENSTR